MTDIEYLKGLRAVRERAHQVLKVAEQGSLTHFHYHSDRMPAVADYVIGIITRDFGPDKFDTIPPHGRWQHFGIGDVPRLTTAIERWESDGTDKVEITRRLIDLFFVSVLLDAGAGDTWKFTEQETGLAYGRSEGIAVASLYMFTAGAFGSDVKQNRPSVDGRSLADLDEETFKTHFQISSSNPIIGSGPRVALLNRAGESLLKLQAVFGITSRPGNLVDYLLAENKGSNKLNYETLWSTLQDLLLPCWPKDRTSIDGVPIGDAWPLEVLKKLHDKDGKTSLVDHIQPFHKLTQWLAYSLAVPFVSVLGCEWENAELGTGLPEYRNGGLFVDLGVLQLKEETLAQGLKSSGASLPSFASSSDVIVEWRAMTVALLDELHVLITKAFSAQGFGISMAQMLEAGTWKGGRELAAEHRPETRSGPFIIEGDGTLF